MSTWHPISMSIHCVYFTGDPGFLTWFLVNISSLVCGLHYLGFVLLFYFILQLATFVYKCILLQQLTALISLDIVNYSIIVIISIVPIIYSFFINKACSPYEAYIELCLAFLSHHGNIGHLVYGPFSFYLAKNTRLFSDIGSGAFGQRSLI